MLLTVDEINVDKMTVNVIMTVDTMNVDRKCLKNWL